MIVAVLKPFTWHEVKECQTREEADAWLDERRKALRRSYPNGEFEATYYEVSQKLKVEP